MQSKATTAFTSGLADANDNIKRALRTKVILNKNRKMLGKMLRSLDNLGVEDLSIRADHGENKPIVKAHLTNLKTFKKAR